MIKVREREREIPFTALFGGEAIAFWLLGFAAGASLSPFTVSLSLVAAFASVKAKQQTTKAIISQNEKYKTVPLLLF